MNTTTLRKRMPVSALADPKIIVPAIGSAFAKLDPRVLMKNPVMFVVEVVAALTTVLLVRDLAVGGGLPMMGRSLRVPYPPYAVSCAVLALTPAYSRSRP